MGAEYLSYVKSIATFAPTFYGYIISVLASVNYTYNKTKLILLESKLYITLQCLIYLFFTMKKIRKK